jgi:hypothetical protein
MTDAIATVSTELLISLKFVNLNIDGKSAGYILFNI